MSGIHIRAQAVLQIFDDFTGKPVGNALVRPVLPHGAWMVSKENGIFVLGGLVPVGDSEKCVIELRSPVYEPYFCELSVSDGGCPCIRVRMTPSPSMPVPEGTTILEGKEEPGIRLMVVCMHPASEMKLLKDAEGERIRIYRENDEELSGRIIAFFKKGEFSETVRVTDEEEEFCVLEHPLEKTYKRGGTGIYCVQDIKTDAGGGFYLWLSRVSAGECPCMILAEKNGVIVRQYTETVQAGSRNRFSGYKPETAAGKKEEM